MKCALLRIYAVVRRGISRAGGEAPSGIWRTQWLVYWSFLFAALVVELVAFAPPFNTAADLGASGRGRLLFTLQHGIRPALITGMIAAVFFAWPVITEDLRLLLKRPQAASIPLEWLIPHLILIVPLAIGTATRTAGRLTSIADGEIWILSWTALGFCSLITLGLAAFPVRLWMRWLRQCRTQVIGAAAIGWTAYLLGAYAESLWNSFQQSTFRLAVLLLKLTGAAVMADPARQLIGTTAFAVQIGPLCSGIEGIGLVSVFLTVYLWRYRAELRFPQAFLLLPFGAAAVWFLNGVRIAALVLIGNWSPDVGARGFHSVAGWLFFNAAACGLIWGSWSSKLFFKYGAGKAAGNPAAAYLLPMLAVLGTSMITTASAPGFELLYPLKVLTVLGAFWLCRTELSALRWKPTWAATLPGVIAAALWIALLPNNSARNGEFSRGLDSLPAFGAAIWLIFRIVGGVITAPIAEELAFRGYLLRKLITSDFANAPQGCFTVFSFAGSSALFGLAHQNWLAGTAAGMIFAAAIYRRGQLADAVLAHSTSNALLSAYVLTTHNWWMWP